MNNAAQTASDMTGHTLLLFLIVAFTVLIALGILSDLQEKWREYHVPNASQGDSPD